MMGGASLVESRPPDESGGRTVTVVNVDEMLPGAAVDVFAAVAKLCDGGAPSEWMSEAGARLRRAPESLDLPAAVLTASSIVGLRMLGIERIYASPAPLSPAG